MVKPGLYIDTFPEVFNQLLDKSDTTCYKISQYSGVNEGYLSRLKSGEKRNPSIEILMSLSFSLVHFSDKIDLHDIYECM